MAPPKLSLRQRQLQSRLKEVEDNFIRSYGVKPSNKNKDDDYERNAKLLSELRDKAYKMGVPYRSNKEIVSASKEYREDKLRRGARAGYQEGVYNPKTKTRDYASPIDQTGNTYDMFDNPTGRKTILNNPIMDAADIAAILVGVGLGIKASIALAKDPSLIVKYPKSIQKKIQSAFSNLKGNKKMASSPKKAAATSVVASLSKLVGSKFSEGTYNAWKNLPDTAKKALEPDLRAGKFSGTGGIGKFKVAADKLKNASKSVSASAKPLPPMPKSTSSPVNTRPTRLNQAKLPEDVVKYFGDEKIANKMKRIWGNLDAGSKSGTKRFTDGSGKGFDLSVADIKQINNAKTPDSMKKVIAKVGVGAVTAAGYVLGVNYLGKTGGPDFKTISGTTEDKLKEGRTRKRATPTGDDELDANARQLRNVSQRPDTLRAKDKPVVKKAGTKPVPPKPKPKPKSDKPIPVKTSKSNNESNNKSNNESNNESKPKKRSNKQKSSIVKDSDRLGIKIARMLGDKRSDEQMVSDRIENEKLEDDMNFRRGGMPRSKAKPFGMGGMYKAPKKKYTAGLNMRYGGATKRSKGY